MRVVIASIPQMIVMAAVVNTALFVPAGAILAFLCFLLFGVSLHGFVTFGGLLHPVAGLILWWAALLVPSLVYSAYMMPWHPSD